LHSDFAAQPLDLSNRDVLAVDRQTDVHCHGGDEKGHRYKADRARSGNLHRELPLVGGGGSGLVMTQLYCSPPPR
jgi:hypothetical protein